MGAHPEDPPTLRSGAKARSGLDAACAGMSGEAVMDALIQQFFNLDIMSRALPLVLQGLQQTILLCLIVIPLGLVGGLALRARVALAARAPCAGA